MDDQVLAALSRLQAELERQAELFDDPRAYRAGVSDALTALKLGASAEPLGPPEAA